MRMKKGSRGFAVMMGQAVPAAFRPNLPPNVDPVLTEDETAQLLGVSKDTLRRENKAGRGPPRVRLSLRRIGYRLSAIYARLDASTERTNSNGVVEMGDAHVQRDQPRRRRK